MKEKTGSHPAAKLWGWARPYHGSFLGSVLLAVLGVACGMIPYFSVAAILRLLLSGSVSMPAYLMWCGIALAGYLGKVLFGSFSTLISHTATYHTLRDLRKALTSKLARVPMGTVLNTPSGQYKTTIVDRVEGMEPTLAHLIPEMTSNALVPIAILVYLLILDWRMALISLITLFIGFIFVARSGKTYAKRWAGAVEAGRRMNNAIVEYIGGIQVVKAFSQSAGSYQKYADAVRANGQYYVDWMGDNLKYMCLWTSVIPAVLVAVLPAGFAFWAGGSLSAPDFLTIIVLSLGLTGPIMAAMTFVDDLAVIGTNVGEISGILETAELERPQEPVRLDHLDIALKNVSFTYGKDSGEVLRGIDLNIRPGTVTALVGPSGSGKSTIAKLIAGFWDVTDGQITVDGCDVRRIPLTQWTAQIAYVSQDNYLFDRSIRENIRMGRKNATDAEVEDAAKASGCEEFIRRLENGYDTAAGSGGGSLSGGERQRVAIARAMLKNAPIVILDEATASIDPENEAAIQKALSALTKGKTLIVIAHHLSTITDADNIVVVKNGKIAAQGKQDELLSTCPVYADMWAAYQGTRDQA
ncbi:putative ABC transporter ATP-binding protein [Caprobacter fermentans]|uniref:Putative ABC transporter ATP-binding protein n=1 Tax=Caproicibacter fermentans TaxID=2576756 RepID=A0A6N8I2H1_9FIRM|nr:ABC transporter ATP-binding protein [Caproicibacter fermentans]MVB12274.1 putative ABC transporter ATP-binding protein [Caproicibacter fermentans]OCN02679.1 ABC transporter ATP-binding protein [Clostridium sp. W14A]